MILNESDSQGIDVQDSLINEDTQPRPLKSTSTFAQTQCDPDKERKVHWSNSEDDYKFIVSTGEEQLL